MNEENQPNGDDRIKLKFALAVTDAILIFALIVFGILWYQVKRDLDARNVQVQELQQQLTDFLEEQQKAEKGSRPKGKEDIIYFNNPLFEAWSEEQMRAHCTELGGTFNPCGRACPDEAEVCIEVCAPRCEFNTTDNEADISAWKTYRNEIFGISFSYPTDWGDVITDNKLYSGIWIGSIKANTIMIYIDTRKTVTRKMDYCQPIPRSNEGIFVCENTVSTSNFIGHVKVYSVLGESFFGEEQDYSYYIEGKINNINSPNLESVRLEKTLDASLFANETCKRSSLEGCPADLKGEYELFKKVMDSFKLK